MDMFEAKMGGYGNGNWKKMQKPPTPTKTRYRCERCGNYYTKPNQKCQECKSLGLGFWNWLFRINKENK